MRRVYIIPKSMRVKDAYDAAQANNCPEILHGIPPILQHEVSEADLPCVYEEQPVVGQPPSSTYCGRIIAIDSTKVRPVRIVREWEGNNYEYDCLVTEAMKYQYIHGDINVGDYVLVHWLDHDKDLAVVFAKVLKTW